MRKFIRQLIPLFLLLPAFSTATAQSPNPIVNRLTSEEIEAIATPAALAYNYVNAILKKDFNKMLSFMNPEGIEWLDQYSSGQGYTYEQLFSEPGGKLSILQWLPAFYQDYELAVLFVQDGGKDEFGRPTKIVYVGCVPVWQIGNVGFQDISRYGDSNVKVVVAEKNGNLSVSGFK